MSMTDPPPAVEPLAAAYRAEALLKRQETEGASIAELLGSSTLFVALLGDDELRYSLSTTRRELDELDKLDIDELKHYPFDESLKALAYAAKVREWWRHEYSLKGYVRAHGLVPVLVALHATLHADRDADVLEYVKANRDTVVDRFVHERGKGTRFRMLGREWSVGLLELHHRAQWLIEPTDAGDDGESAPWLRYAGAGDDGGLFWRLRDEFEEQGLDEPMRRAWDAVVERAARRVPAPREPLEVTGVYDPRRRQPAPRRWVVDELIVASEVVWLAAPSGTGKTTLAIAIAGAVSVGRPFLGRAVSPGRVLFATREALDDDDVPNKLLELGYGDDVWNNLMLWRNPPIARLDTPAGGVALAAVVREWGPFELIVLDSARAFVAGVENASETWNDFRLCTMLALRALEPTPAVLVIDHMSTEESARPRGSTTKGDIADTAYKMRRRRGRLHDAVTVLELVNTKFRVKRPEHIRLERRYEADGRCIFTALDHVDDGDDGDDGDDIHAELDEAIRISLPADSHRELESAVRDVLGEGFVRRAFRARLEELVADGTVTATPGPHRSTRYSWAGQA
jgi:hypothetical protein